ncbi:MAG: DUF3656 domain-containing protein [Bacteroidales bacterium]|nr:DUF3656 domain-containing protein [Bacteroidales bacterium]
MSVKLELLAPAKNRDIGIAAIDCGADAVYIAGPSFGARENAGNSFEEIAKLVEYAHQFGVKIYLTLNTILYDHELESARETIFSAYDAGVDAVIIQDLGILKMELPPIELHASTQCNIRSVAQARFMESLGFPRIILARELSIEQIKEISEAVNCEIESFVHGALCVSYSGQCYLSQYLTGRSANRGSCIQACRSRYDLLDINGNTILKDKSILSLKDLALDEKIEEMADAGICSFKIEGRLKNISYVKNIVRHYRNAIDKVIARSSGKYSHASFGKITGGFTPNPSATFSRGFTQYFINGTRSQWSSMDIAKGVGELVGNISSIDKRTKNSVTFSIKPSTTFKGQLNNGDGLCLVTPSGEIEGVRADIANGNTITTKFITSLAKGTTIYRNYNHRFEKEIENNTPKRLIDVDLDITFTAQYECIIEAFAQSGVRSRAIISGEDSKNKDLALNNIIGQLSKSSGLFKFRVRKISGENIPFIPAKNLNAIRSELAQDMVIIPPEENDNIFVPTAPWEEIDKNKIIPPQRKNYLNCANHLSKELYHEIGIDATDAFELNPDTTTELMRTKYCIRHELGLCPKIKKGEKPLPLLLVNNGRKLKVSFDCALCQMSITPHIGN